MEPEPGSSVVVRAAPMREWRIAGVLFGTTLLSTLVTGAGLAGSPYSLFDLPELLADPPLFAAQLARGFPFAGTLLGILGVHELGHYFAAKHHGVPTTPPFFIPFPSYVGTLGAVIRLRSTIPTRNALVDIGASGPLAGALVALPLLVLGLASSEVRPIHWVPPVLPPQSLVGLFLSGGWLQTEEVIPGAGLGVVLLERAVLGPVPAGHYVKLDAMALAAWFGLLVTALNLLPIGQLDGGHVVAALGGQRARAIGRVTIALLVVLGCVAWMGWLFWALVGWKIVGTGHPPVDRPSEPLDSRRRAIAWATVFLLVVSFVPVPAMVP